MKLIIDIGNSRAKMAVFREDRIVDFVLSESIQLVELQELLKKHPDIHSAMLSSVKTYPREIDAFLLATLSFVKLEATTPLPFKNRYRNPRSLGKDRIAIAAAAHALYPSEAVLAIDAGTTITYDLVNHKGEYLGGSISPGIHMRLKALHTFTGQLPLVEMSSDEVFPLVGDDTKSAIFSGVVHGVVAEMDGLIERYAEIFQGLKVILGGGDYKYFDKRLKNNIFALPNIVLVGLKEILNFNEEK